MEWLEIASKLTLTAALFGATITLWRQNREQAAEIRALHAARLDDLKAIARLKD